MGHSIASRYNTTSIGLPLTYGSGGNIISRGVGVSTSDGVLDTVPKLSAAARRVPLGLKGELACCTGAGVDVGEAIADDEFENDRSDEPEPGTWRELGRW